MKKKIRFSILDYVDYIIAAIFIFTIIFIVATIVFGIPWIVGIIEQLVDKL